MQAQFVAVPASTVASTVASAPGITALASIPFRGHLILRGGGVHESIANSLVEGKAYVLPGCLEMTDQGFFGGVRIPFLDREKDPLVALEVHQIPLR